MEDFVEVPEVEQILRGIVRFASGEVAEFNINTDDYKLAIHTLLDQPGAVCALVRIK